MGFTWGLLLMFAGRVFSSTPLYSAMSNMLPSEVWWGHITVLMCVPTLILSLYKENQVVIVLRAASNLCSASFWISICHLMWIAGPINTGTATLGNIALFHFCLFGYHATRSVIRPMRHAHQQMREKTYACEECPLDGAEDRP